MKRFYGLLLVLFLFGCSQHSKIITPNYILESRPQAMPVLQDFSPKVCLECLPVNSQKMWKFTERDFISVKQKLIELDDYIEYLLHLLKPKNSS